MSKLTKNKLALLALAGLVVGSGPTFAAETASVKTRGGLEAFYPNNEDYWFRIGGRLFVDQAWFDGNDQDRSGFPSGSFIRSSRIGLKGGVGKNWVYKFDVIFADFADSGGRSFIDEAFIGYNFCKNLWLAIGQFSIPFGLESWASASDYTFMELSLPSQAFSPDLGIGLYLEWHGQCFTFAGTIYQPPSGTRQFGDTLSIPPTFASADPALNGRPIAGTGIYSSAPGSDTLGYAARITFSPIHDECTVYHAGFSGRYEKFHPNGNGFNYWTYLEANSRQTPAIFANIPPNSVHNHTVWGAELAGRWGPFMLSGEYMWVVAQRDTFYPAGDLRNPAGNLNYNGYYVMGSYILTGESKAYDFDSGTFEGVTPNCKTGAWEIAVRHSYVDLLDRNLSANPFFFFVDFVPSNAVNDNGGPAGNFGNNFATGFDIRDRVGSAHGTTIGLTWWVNTNIRFMANYVRASVPGATAFLENGVVVPPGDNINLNIFGLRAQVSW